MRVTRKRLVKTSSIDNNIIWAGGGYYYDIIIIIIIIIWRNRPPRPHGKRPEEARDQIKYKLLVL